MKVLHLPSNVASQMAVMVRSLRDIGIEARGLVLNNSPICEATALENYPLVVPNPRSPRNLPALLRWWRATKEAMRWADVIHWHFGSPLLPWDLHLRYAARVGKPRLVEFWGTDIRIPEVAAAGNPYVARMYKEHPELVRAGRRSSHRLQERFARYGFRLLLPGCGLEEYVREDLFPEPLKIMQQVMLSDYEPRYPDPANPRPLVVHFPSDPRTKGTEAVLRAVEALRGRYEFDFQLLHAAPRPQVIGLLQQSDILLDQFVLGSHGMATLEAMACGKPSVCYIQPSALRRYPSDLPVVNATQENLPEVLAGLLADGWRRHQIGVRSRAYVEKYHDAHQIARQLAGIYQELLAKHDADKARAGR
ncbi:MAG: hypothetical protein ACUVUC_03385 [Thermoguttaceae bacterium]